MKAHFIHALLPSIAVLLASLIEARMHGFDYHRDLGHAMGVRMAGSAEDTDALAACAAGTLDGVGVGAEVGGFHGSCGSGSGGLVGFTTGLDVASTTASTTASIAISTTASTSTTAAFTTTATTTIDPNRLPSWTTTLLCYDVLLATALLWCWAIGCFGWMGLRRRLCVRNGDEDNDEDEQGENVRRRRVRGAGGLEGEMRRLGLV